MQILIKASPVASNPNYVNSYPVGKIAEKDRLFFFGDFAHWVVYFRSIIPNEL